MAGTPPVDVLIFEDRPHEADQIRRWFGLPERRCPTASVFPAPEPAGVPAIEAAVSGWRRVEGAIRHHDPKVVVMDVLLSRSFGQEPYDGLVYARWCKRLDERDIWPAMGVIVVTTGGDASSGGRYLPIDVLGEQNVKFGWRIDYIWGKPWIDHPNPADWPDVRNTVEQLIGHSRRPSEQ